MLVSLLFVSYPIDNLAGNCVSSSCEIHPESSYWNTTFLVNMLIPATSKLSPTSAPVPSSLNPFAQSRPVAPNPLSVKAQVLIWPTRPHRVWPLSSWALSPTLHPHPVTFLQLLRYAHCSRLFAFSDSTPSVWRLFALIVLWLTSSSLWVFAYILPS